MSMRDGLSLPFKPAVTDEDYKRLLNFVHLDSREAVNDFSSWVHELGNKNISAWWDHKLSFKWILPCLIKVLSPMYSEDWDAILSNTNTGESQHHWTNKLTGINLTLVAAAESAREVDTNVMRQIKVAAESGAVQNSNNNLINRVSRSLRCQDLAVEKSREVQKVANKTSEIHEKINTEKESRKESMAREKALKEQLHELKAAHSSSSGAVTKIFSKKPQGTKAKAAESNSSGRVNAQKTMQGMLFLYLR
ncbi:hypothetical protein MPER_09420 [Moniliophthora perniciosa FA553]|nr:hypothetical protein MPER_09420 [Moniliophthora perniciosa FA553]